VNIVRGAHQKGSSPAGIQKDVSILSARRSTRARKKLLSADDVSIDVLPSGEFNDRALLMNVYNYVETQGM
jgi:hypothetical protein